MPVAWWETEGGAGLHGMLPKFTQGFGWVDHHLDHPWIKSQDGMIQVGGICISTFPWKSKVHCILGAQFRLRWSYTSATPGWPVPHPAGGRSAQASRNSFLAQSSLSSFISFKHFAYGGITQICTVSQHELGNRRSGAPTARSPSALSVILGQQVKLKYSKWICSYCRLATDSTVEAMVLHGNIFILFWLLNYSSATWERQGERLFIVPTAKWFLIIIFRLAGETICFLLLLFSAFVPVTSSCCEMM